MLSESVLGTASKPGRLMLMLLKLAEFVIGCGCAAGLIETTRPGLPFAGEVCTMPSVGGSASVEAGCEKPSQQRVASIER